MNKNLSNEMIAALKVDTKLCSEIPCSGPSDLTAYRHQYNHSRAYWNQDGPKMAYQQDWHVEHNGSAIPCRTHVPVSASTNELNPTIVFFHGGGWVLGNLQTHDRMMRELAERTGHIIIGVDYKLSPESRFPEAHDDAVAVVQFILDHNTELAIVPSNVSLCGDSAGAHMALYCAIKTATSHPGQLKSLCLIYGSYGLTDSISRRTQGTPEVGLSDDDMQFYTTALLGENVNPKTCGFDLLEENLQGVPPALVTCCTLDPLRDDSAALCARLNQFSIENRLSEYAQVLHGYAHMSSHLPDARTTLQECADWICQHNH